MNHIYDTPCEQGVFPAQESWADLLDLYLDELNTWLLDPVNVNDAIASIESVLISKHHDYGGDNLKTFGELGILVRATDKIARLKNLMEMQGEVTDETLDDTWRDLAGYALQALIMRKMPKISGTIDYFDVRKNRLIRGVCPDCGEGVLLRSGHELWNGAMLYCSKRCGFAVYDFYLVTADLGDCHAVINHLAAKSAVTKQK